MPGLILLTSTLGEEPKATKPTALLAIPFVLERGQTTRCLIRGQGLEAIEKLETPSGVTATIISKEEAKLPEGWKAELIGDRQVTCEITIDASFVGEKVSLRLAGDVSIDLAVVDALLEDKEPNPGFREAQEIVLGKTVRGSIGTNKDVDVFRFEAREGMVLDARIIARERGSALDPMLKLYDDSGFERASSDDTPEAGRDAAFRLTLPTSGRYYLVVQDAHDSGSEAHVYRLELHVATP